MLFLISTADLTIFLTIFFRKWRQFCSPEGAATDGVFKICAARRHPRKIQANGTLRRCLRLPIWNYLIIDTVWYFMIFFDTKILFGYSIHIFSDTY